MRRLQQKRSIAKFLCFLLILEMFVAFPNVAEAKTEGIKRGTLKEITVAANEDPLTITLYDPSKPENTKVVSSTVPSWITVTKTSYYSASFTVKFQKNTSSSRTATIQFTEGSYIWYAKITQNKPTPSTKPATKEPTKKVTTKPTQKPTPVPTKAPTPMPELTASEASLGFPADGATKTVTISGYTGTLRADRNDTWFTVSVSGGTISVTATKNTSTARASYVDVTDTGSGRSVRIQVTQAAPIYNPEPSKAPTNTPTPIPAETLPVKTKKLQFGAQGGQDTLTLDGKGYNLAFSYPDNPSVPTGWVTMSYENGKIIVRVKQNKNHAPRSMKVTITDRNTNQYAYVTINQSAAPTPTPAYLNVDRKEISCDSKGGEETVTLRGLVGVPGYSFTWEPAEDNGWVKVKPEGNKLRFTIDENRTIKTRTATILIKDSQTKKDVTVTIKQEAMPNKMEVITGVLSAEDGAVSFDSKSGKKSVKIYGNVGMIQANRVGKDAWFSARAIADSIEISVEENTGLARIGYVDVVDAETLKYIRLTILQDSKPIQPLEVDHRALTFSADEGTQKIKVSGRVGILVLSRKNNANWFTAKEENGYIVIEVEENTGAPRTGYLDISDKGTGDSTWVAIYQNSKSMDENSPEEKDYTPELSFDGLQLTYSWNKGDEVIPLNSSDKWVKVKYLWNQEKNKNWAHVRSDGENLCINVDENEDVNYRSVEVLFYSAGDKRVSASPNGSINPYYCIGKITITQEGAPITARLAAEPALFIFGANGGTKETVITGLSGAPTIKKSEDASWLSIEEIGPFMNLEAPYGSGYRVKFTVPENDGGERKTPVYVIDMKTGQQLRMAVYQSPAPGIEGESNSDTEAEENQDDNISSDDEFRSVYLIKYDANGGTDAPPTQYKGCYEDDFALSTSIPKRLGYDFAGWGVLPSSSHPSYQPGDKFNRNMDVTLYAIWEADGFWDRYEVTHDIREPKNSAVSGAKNSITMDKYWKIFHERKEHYIELCDLTLASWDPSSVNILDLERVSLERDKKYIANIRSRIVLLNIAGAVGENAPIVPDAAHFLGYYLSAKGGKVTYGLQSYLDSKNPIKNCILGDRNVVTECFNYEANYLMREMEKGLHENQSIVVTDINAGRNVISFTKNKFSGIPSNTGDNYNGFYGIKEGTYGLSAKCSYDGEIYVMEVGFYLQDFYDFYYEANDWNNQGRNWVPFGYVDELAFLVPWGYAKPFENTGILRAFIIWRKGQTADLKTRVYNADRLIIPGKNAALYVYPDK